jgi:sugar phosphate isomerase/epimerase
MILGAQFYTLRNSCKTLEGLEESMKKVADMGFTAIQLSGVCAYEAEWAYEKAKENGLKIAITHFAYDKIINDTEATIEFHKKMDCPYIGLGAAPAMLTEYEKYLSEIPAAMDKIAAAGLKFMYHNHDMEFARYPENGKIYIDDMLDRFPADKMGVTMDTYWVQAGGGDPAQWIMKLKGRNDCVHFKDMIGFITKDENGKPKRGHQIAPIGEGNMNYDAIIEACLKADVKYGFVELDDCHGEDPFACMERSYKFLTSRYGLK